MKRYQPHRKGEQGAILIIAVIFATALASLAYSSFTTVEANMQISRHEADALRAELAAQSGLAFGMRQLSADPDWEGTDYAIEFAPGASFECVTGEVDGGASGSIGLGVTAEAGDGYRELGAELTPNGGSFEGEVALAMLGGDDDLMGVEIYGDVLITDMENMVFDWTCDGDDICGYELAGPDFINGSDLHCSYVDGTIWKFTNEDYAGWPANEVVIDTPHMMPEWNLDEYIESGSGGGCGSYGSSGDYIVYRNVTKIQNRNFYKPVVIINDPGKNIYIKNCKMWSGLVVWCPSDYDLRSGPRQTLKVKNSVLGSHCRPETIGVIAPACEFQQISGCSWSYGFSFLGEVKKMQNMYMEGMVYVVNRVKQIKYSEFTYDEYIYENLPPGINLENDFSGYTIARMGEMN